MTPTRLAESRARYLADSAPVRLAGLAANLARIASFTLGGASFESVLSLLEESKYFIEWTAREVPLETQIQLLDLQRQLVRWTALWSQVSVQAHMQQELSATAHQWADRTLRLSRLLEVE